LNITTYSLHPGAIKTNLQRYFTLEKYLFGWISEYLSKTIEQGSATTIYCATHDVQQNSGRYFSDSNLATPKPYAIDPANAQSLWVLSQEYIDQFEKSANPDPYR